MNKTLLLYTAGWLPMVVIAIANGTLRELGYGRFMTELRSHQLSSYIATVAFFSYTYVLNIFIPLETSSEALAVGTIWLILTVSFEFVFGRYVAGLSWEKLFSDYNLFKGRLWILVLCSVFMSPLLIFYGN